MSDAIKEVAAALGGLLTPVLVLLHFPTNLRTAAKLSSESLARTDLEEGGLAPLQSAQNRKSESPITRGRDARCLQAAQEEVKPVLHDPEAQKIGK